MHQGSWRGCLWTGHVSSTRAAERGGFAIAHSVVPTSSLLFFALLHFFFSVSFLFCFPMFFLAFFCTSFLLSSNRPTETTSETRLVSSKNIKKKPTLALVVGVSPALHSIQCEVKRAAIRCCVTGAAHTWSRLWARESVLPHTRRPFAGGGEGRMT